MRIRNLAKPDLRQSSSDRLRTAPRGERSGEVYLRTGSGGRSRAAEARRTEGGIRRSATGWSGIPSRARRGEQFYLSLRPHGDVPEVSSSRRPLLLRLASMGWARTGNGLAFARLGWWATCCVEWADSNRGLTFCCFCFSKTLLLRHVFPLFSFFSFRWNPLFSFPYVKIKNPNFNLCNKNKTKLQYFRKKTLFLW